MPLRNLLEASRQEQSRLGLAEGALPETIDETSRALSAKLRNSNLNLILIELEAKPWNVLDKG